LNKKKKSEDIENKTTYFNEPIFLKRNLRRGRQARIYHYYKHLKHHNDKISQSNQKDEINIENMDFDDLLKHGNGLNDIFLNEYDKTQ